jgi:hypothetical protein
MARKPRLYFPSAFYHCINRGIQRSLTHELSFMHKNHGRTFDRKVAFFSHLTKKRKSVPLWPFGESPFAPLPFRPKWLVAVFMTIPELQLKALFFPFNY